MRRKCQRLPLSRSNVNTPVLQFSAQPLRNLHSLPGSVQKLKEAARDDEAAARGVEVSLQQASKGEGPGEAIGGESMQEQDDPHEPVTIKES